jgi:hypothetical protein
MKNSGRKSHTRSHSVLSFRYSNTWPRSVSVTPFPVGFSLSTVLFYRADYTPGFISGQCFTFLTTYMEFELSFLWHNHCTESENLL